MESKAFVAAIADAFVTRQDNPPVLPDHFKPDLIRRAAREVRRQSLDRCAGAGERINDRKAVERFVQEKDERLKPL